MTRKKTIPLLLLPYLAICTVLDHFNLNKLIQFSLCSKRCQRIACRKPKGKVEIALIARKSPEVIVLLNGIERYTFVISGTLLYLQEILNSEKFRVGPHVVPSKSKACHTETFWRDVMTGFEAIATYITELLKTPITELVLLSESTPNDMVRVIDFVMGKQKSVPKCSFDTMTYTDKYLAYLLNNCKITDSLSLSVRPGKKFRHPWNLEIKTLSFSYGEWLTGKNLLSMNSRFVNICNTNFNSRDLNRFLKNWQNGGCPDLKYMRLEVKPMDWGVVTSGIPVADRQGRVNRIYTYFGNKAIAFDGGFDIKRNDGMIGTIFENHGIRFLFGVKHPEPSD